MVERKSVRSIGATIVSSRRYNNLLNHELIACDISDGVKRMFEKSPGRMVSL